MTDPIQAAIDRTLAGGEVVRNANAEIVRDPNKPTLRESLEEAQGLLRQSRVTIDNLRLSVDGERRVKEQYLAELRAVNAMRLSDGEKVRAMKDQIKLMREARVLGRKLYIATVAIAIIAGLVAGLQF
jgi:hypothetical protein